MTDFNSRIHSVRPSVRPSIGMVHVHVICHMGMFEIVSRPLGTILAYRNEVHDDNRRQILEKSLII
jgi:hypothetical protein